MTVSIKQNSQSLFILKLSLVQGQLLGIQRILKLFSEKNFFSIFWNVAKNLQWKVPTKNNSNNTWNLNEIKDKNKIFFFFFSEVFLLLSPHY